MKKLCYCLVLCALTLVPFVASAQETITPPSLGGTSSTRVVNGQTVEVTTYGAADVSFTEVSNYTVKGTATRTAGTDPVTVVIRWVNRNMQTTVIVAADPVAFSMESGDIDKRTSSQTTD